MKRIVFFCFFLYTLFYVSVHISYASTLPNKIRIGLEAKYKAASTIPISSNSITVGFGNDNNFFDMAQISSTSGFSATVDNCYFVKVPQTFQNYDQAKKAAIAFGQNACPALTEAFNFSIYVSYQSISEAQNAARTIGGTVLEPTLVRIMLKDLNVPVIILDYESGSPEIRGMEGTTKIGDKSYRGGIEFCINTDKKITPVNVLGVDEYLYGVVSSEMPHIWHYEAIKAQAVAARSYTYTCLDKHFNDGYNMCDKTHCQFYNGVNSENAISSQAVDETKGMMVYYDNKPIVASYFSSSGGYTEDSENVWSEATPYLRAVNDANEVQTKIWTRHYTLEEVSKMLINGGYNIGRVVSVSITIQSYTSRVTTMTIQGSNGSVTLTKESIRTLFNSSSDGILESRNFTIANGILLQPDEGKNSTTVHVLNDNTLDKYNLRHCFVLSNDGKISNISEMSVIGENNSVYTYPDDFAQENTIISNGNEVILSGKGLGHGVGLSQYGAKGMAENGYDFIQILQYYYTSTIVK